MGRRTRECYLCAQGYNYCPTCSQDKMKPTWMAEFHDENCKSIFDICTRFNMQLISKDEAKAALEKCDLSNKANFKSYVKRDLENIFAEDNITVSVEAEIKEVTADEVVVEVEPVLRNKAKNKAHEVVKKENK